MLSTCSLNVVRKLFQGTDIDDILVNCKFNEKFNKYDNTNVKYIKMPKYEQYGIK